MRDDTLVLLPGMMCDERLFKPQMEAFGDRFDIVVPRLEQETIESMARHVLDLVDADRFTCAGLSMGGIVAMAMVGMAPQRVKRLGLFDTNHLAELPERFAIRNRQIEDVRAGRLRQVIVDEMKPVYLAEINRGNQELLDLLVEMAVDCGPDAFVLQSLALRDRTDGTEFLRNYRGPSLVLCGAQDALCPPQRHREIARLLTQADLVIVPDAGHISTLEQPQRVNLAMAQWLSRPPCRPIA